MWILLALCFLGTQLSAQDFLEEGNQALDAKQYDRAIELFTKAAAANPNDYGAEFQLALTYSLLGRDGDAIPHYEKTLALHPGLYEAELNLGMSLYRMHKAPEAAPHFRAASAAKPAEFRPALGLAQSLFDTKQYAEAEPAFKKAIELNPMSAPAEAGLAMSLGRQNRVDEAAQHFQKAFDLDRSYRSAFVELALLYEANHRDKEAITFYRMFPDNPVALEHLGALLTKNGELKEAIQTLESVVEKKPSSASRIALAEAYLADKQPAKAEAVIAPEVQAAPGDFQLRMFYGRLLRDQRKFPDAAAQFAALAKAKPDSVEAWNELANVLVVAGQYEQGLDALDHIRALGKESPGNHFYRALSLDRLKQRPEAIESYKKFLEVSQGKFPDQEFQARGRIRTLEADLKKR